MTSLARLSPARASAGKRRRFPHGAGLAAAFAAALLLAAAGWLAIGAARRAAWDVEREQARLWWTRVQAELRESARERELPA